MAGHSLKLLKSRNFLPLFITQFLGAFNDNLFRFAVIMMITFGVTNTTTDPAILNNLAIAMFILPYFLFSALAGELADKYEKSGQIKWIKIWEIGLMSAGAIGFYTQNIYILIGVLSGLGLQSTFFGPIKYGILPQHLKREDLLGGSALIEAGTFIAILLGTTIGALIAVGDGSALNISLFTVVIAVLGTLSGLYVPKTPRADPDLKINLNIFSSTGQRLRRVYRSHIAWPAIMGISWIWAFGSIYLTQIPVITKEMLRGDETVVTLFLCCFSVGVGAGSLFCSRILKGEISARLAPKGLVVLTALCCLLFFLIPDEPRELIIMTLPEFLSEPMNVVILINVAFIAMLAGVVIVPLYAILLDQTDPAERSRVIASTNIINSGFMVLAGITAALLAALGFATAEIALLTGILSLAFIFPVKKLHSRLLDQDRKNA